VLFFDGECGFCTRSVRWVYHLDEKGRVVFAPLQGESAKELGLLGYAEKGGGSMVILRELDGKTFLKSEALIELGRTLGGLWRLLAVLFSIFPKRLRDGVYDLVAKNRYRLSGACVLPDEVLRGRMRR
jgi:predicted DCC family thiol-disulfide oxidoreductase YuxK